VRFFRSFKDKTLLKMASTPAQKGFLAVTFLATLAVFTSATVNAAFAFNPQNIYSPTLNLSPDYWNRSAVLYIVRLGCAILTTIALVMAAAIALPVYYAAAKGGFTTDLPLASLYITIGVAAISLIGGWVLVSTPAPADIIPSDTEQYTYWEAPATYGAGAGQLFLAIVALGVGIAALVKR